MKLLKETLLLSSGLMYLAMPVAGLAQQFGDFQYSVNGGQNVIITGYTGLGGDVTIPGSINGLPVAFINQTAFSGKSTITSIAIPSSVTGILGANPLVCGDCANLVAITVDPLNQVFSGVDGVLFIKNQTTLLEYPTGKIGSYAIPVGVTRVASYAFDTCINLTSLTIPNTVTNIHAYGFVGCSGLSTVTFPDSVETIADYAFNDCYGLTNILFMGNAPAVGMRVFGVDFPSPAKIIYYLPSTTGWSSTFAGIPTAPWSATAATPNIQSNQFGFDVGGPPGMVIVVEASCCFGKRAEAKNSKS